MGYNVRKYHHLLARVEYPRERGYRMEAMPLPDWIYITITDDLKGSKYLTVYSRFHIPKEVKINPSYSSDFNDRDIIKDLSGEIAGRFL